MTVFIRSQNLLAKLKKVLTFYISSILQPQKFEIVMKNARNFFYNSKYAWAIQSKLLDSGNLTKKTCQK